MNIKIIKENSYNRASQKEVDRDWLYFFQKIDTQASSPAYEKKTNERNLSILRAVKYILIKLLTFASVHGILDKTNE